MSAVVQPTFLGKAISQAATANSWVYSEQPLKKVENITA
jgi:hypothetical protein